MLLVLPGIQASNAQTPSQPGKRIALLIGNSAYTGEGWRRLDNAAKDAQDLGNELKRLGFLPQDVQVLQNIDKYAMQTALARFSEQAKKADQVVFYFAGHGIEENKQNFLIDVKAPALNDYNLEASGVSLDEVLAKISVGNGLKLVMIDACRVRPSKGGRQSNTGGLAPPGSTAAETLVVFAAAAGKLAYDGEGQANGFFTQGLLAGLRAEDPSFLGVMKVAAAKVAELAKKEGKTQEVTKYGGVRAEGAFAFAPAPPARDAKIDAREADFAKRVAEFEKRVQSQPQQTQPAAAFATARELPQDCDVCPTMVALPAGSYLRGAAAAERAPYLAAGGTPSFFDDALPQKQVSIKAFAIGKFEVTQGQWQAVMGGNPSNFKDCGEDCPVDSVSWLDAHAYIAKINARTNNRFGYRLPTEAEWEYAARAGTQTAFYTGNTIATSQANINGTNGNFNNYGESPKGSSFNKTVQVGSYAPNQFGLHDILGNVWEWVQDCFADNYNLAPTDGTAYEPVSKAKDCQRIARGGAFSTPAVYLRSATRMPGSPSLDSNGSGLRLARTLLGLAQSPSGNFWPAAREPGVKITPSQ